MGIPWLLALKVVPWGTILANAPAILRSADALARRTRERPDEAAGTDVQALVSRVAQLEQRDNETAELLTRVTAQVAELTAAGQVLEARASWSLALAVTASVIAVLACGIALLAR